MKIGIGLPAAVPRVDGTSIAEWARVAYYGADQAHHPLADTPTAAAALDAELDKLAAAGVTDIVFVPMHCRARRVHRIAAVAACHRSATELAEVRA
jgi:hypothetical protein